jgi:hypothetical protein
MMLVSIVGHASFHTAGRSGPSTIERSYRGRSGRAADVGDVAARATGAAASVNADYRSSGATLFERAIIASTLHGPAPAKTKYKKRKQ